MSEEGAGEGEVRGGREEAREDEIALFRMRDDENR